MSETLRVAFELPASVAAEAGLTPENASENTRRMLALFLFEHGRLSLGQACEMGQMSYWEFYDMNRRLGISLPYSAEDLSQDLARLSDG